MPTIRSDADMSGFTWAWPAVLAGLFTSLVVQILLTMLGFGIGLLSLDIGADASAAGVSWSAFTWWAIAGIIAAFAGGLVAAGLSPDVSRAGRVGHALAAWAVATVVVIGVASMTAGSVAGIASNLAGPAISVATRLDNAASTPAPARETTGQAASAPVDTARVEEAQRQFGSLMLGSFIALVLGAGAAALAGVSVSRRPVHPMSDLT